MGLRFPDQKYGQWFFVTTTFRDWQRFGDLPCFYDRLGESLEFCVKKYDSLLAGYVFMPSHVHLLVGINGVHLGDLMRDFKKFIAQKIAVDYGLTGSIWMPRYDRVVIVTEELFRTKLNYIHDNPVREGLVVAQTDWKWSSAADYFTERRGPVTVYKAWA